METRKREDERPRGARLRAAAGASIVALLASAPGAALTLDWVTVGDPGNPADSLVMNCCEDGRGLTGFGSVPYTYRISRYEITVADWVELLNAVAASDPNGLYNDNNDDRFMSRWVERSGSDGSYAYATLPGTDDLPIGLLDFYDTLRFANWLHNGQPTGAQDATTTEDGAYTLTGTSSPGVVRNPGATHFLASEDEWYKAAFYDPVTRSYFLYATGSSVPPAASPPPGGPNTANFANPAGCFDPPTNLGPCAQTPVGAYADAPSPVGTYDQGGNHLEWNESIYAGGDRGFRGGWWARGVGDLGAFNDDNLFPDCQNCGGMGFRVASLHPGGPPACADGLDQDGDGQADFPDDAGCDDLDDDDERSPLLPCDDGVDNDLDGRADFDPLTAADPGHLAGAGDPACRDTLFPREHAACQDGANNDFADDLVDFDGGVSIHGACAGGSCPPGVSDPDQDGVADPDPQCGAPWRNNENTSGCGLGFELAALALLLARLRRVGR